MTKEKNDFTIEVEDLGKPYSKLSDAVTELLTDRPLCQEQKCGDLSPQDCL